MRVLLQEREANLAATRDDLAEKAHRLSEAEIRLAEANDMLVASERRAAETELELESRNWRSSRLRWRSDP